MDAPLRDWAGIPVHIVDMLVIKLDQFSDYVRFCGVCPQWRNAALVAKVDHNVNLYILKASCRKLPMLIFQTDKISNERRIVVDVTNRETFNAKLPISYKYRFVGSSRGWLFCVGRDMAVTLVNPITNGCISLPVLNDPREEWRKRYFQFFIRKGILLSDPDASPDSFVVLIIYGGRHRLAFFKSGEQSWNFINSEGLICQDITHYKGKLYGVDRYGKLVEIDLPSKTIRTIVPGNNGYSDVAYLVESQDGELLMVKRAWNDDDDDDVDLGEDSQVEAAVAEYSGNEDNDDNNIIDHHSESESYDSESECKPASTSLTDDDFPLSHSFKVFKMTPPIEEGSSTWVKINNIGQQSLFVGDNQSMSVSTFDSGCIPNSIYYITAHHNSHCQYSYRGSDEDSGIFELEDESLYFHYVLGSSKKYVQPPIWFMPNPQ